MGMTIFDFDDQFTELMDRALNELSSTQFAKFLNDVLMILSDYKDAE